MESPKPAVKAMSRPVLFRFAVFLLLWLALIGPGLSDLAPGLLAAGLATWASLRLMPPSAGQLRFVALAALAARFVWQSVAAGVDVARRVFHPRLPLEPGFVTVRLSLPPGSRREAFLALSSLMPGTVPAGFDAEGRLIVHCLDVRRPAAAQVLDDEARFRGAWAEGGADV